MMTTDDTPGAAALYAAVDSTGRHLSAVELGALAAAADEWALSMLAAPDGAPERVEVEGVPGGIALYLDQKGFAALVGTQPSHLRRLRGQGRLIAPDVKIGTVWGWSRARAVLWGIETGYLHPDGTRNPERAGRPRIKQAPEHWRRDVVTYLTQTETATFLGITDAAVYQARERGAGPVEAIRIGELRGWELEALRTYNRRRDPRRRALSRDAGLPIA